MRNPSRQRFVLFAIGFLALILCLWIIWDGLEDGSSHTASLTSQTTGGDGVPESGSVRERDPDRELVRREVTRSASREESPPNRRRPPPANGSEKRRSVQSIITGIVTSSEDGAAIQDARITVSPVGS